MNAPTGTPSATGPGAAPAAGRAFISHASPDAAIANRLCAALEAAGVPCWIAPRDVHAGESYAAAIVQAINGCRALVLLVSQHSVGSVHVLREVERASSKNRPVLSVRLDAATLPPDLEYFLSVNHWLDASAGDIEAILPSLVAALSGPGPGPAPVTATASQPAPLAPAATKQKMPNHWAMAIALVATVFGLYRSMGYWNDRHYDARPATAAPSTSADAAAPAGFAPPAHSVAVLPFLNLSGDKEQEYFSDGLSEELLNALANISDLQVAARTSSFTFKGSQADTMEIARKLNVGALIEGSVRKAGNQVRISAQLINAVTGFQIWSKTYDRDLRNALTVQSEVAREVTRALQGSLLDAGSKGIEPGGTNNPAAYDAYLRGERLRHGPIGLERDEGMLAAYGEALRLDPAFAKAHLGIALAQLDKVNYVPASEVRAMSRLAQGSAEAALRLAPGLAEAHSVLSRAFAWQYEFARASAETARAYALAPGNAEVLRELAMGYANLGRAAEAVRIARRVTELDPLNPASHAALGNVYVGSHQPGDAIQEFSRSLELQPDDPVMLTARGLAHGLLGHFDAAVADCATSKPDWGNRTCLAIMLHKLGRKDEARTQLEALRKEFGDTASFQQAQVLAAWGDNSAALDALEAGFRVQDPGLASLKVDPYLDPLRGEPRFRALLKKLNFPD